MPRSFPHEASFGRGLLASAVCISQLRACCSGEVDYMKKKAHKISAENQRINFMGKIILMLAVVAASALCKADDTPCVRKYSDEQIFSLVKNRLGLSEEYEVYVNWKNCKYYILLYSIPTVVDNQKIIVADSEGDIVEGPR